MVTSTVLIVNDHLPAVILSADIRVFQIVVRDGGWGIRNFTEFLEGEVMTI